MRAIVIVPEVYFNSHTREGVTLFTPSLKRIVTFQLTHP